MALALAALLFVPTLSSIRQWQDSPCCHPRSLFGTNSLTGPIGPTNSSAVAGAPLVAPEITFYRYAKGTSVDFNDATINQISESDGEAGHKFGMAATMYPTYRYSPAARNAMAVALFGSPYYIGDDVSATTYAQLTGGDKLAVDGAIFATALSAQEQGAVTTVVTRFFDRVYIDMSSAKIPAETSAYATLAAVSPSAAANWASDVAAGKDYADRFFVHLVKQSVTAYPAAYEPFWAILGYPTPPTNPTDAQVEACARLAGESDFRNRTAGTMYPTQREAQSQALYGKAYRDLTFFERRYADAAVYANLPSVFGTGASADAARAATRDAVASGMKVAGYIVHNTYATCTGAEQAIVNQAIFATALPGPSQERDYIDFAAVPGAVLDWGAEMSAPLPLTQNTAYLTLKSQVTATAASHWAQDVGNGVHPRQAFYRWLSKETVVQVVAKATMIQLGLGEFTLKIRNLNGYLISVDSLNIVCQVESSATGPNVLVDAARQTVSEKIWVPANGEANVTVTAPIKTYDVITWAILSGKSSADAQKLAADVWRQFQAGTATWHVTASATASSDTTTMTANYILTNAHATAASPTISEAVADAPLLAPEITFYRYAKGTSVDFNDATINQISESDGEAGYKYGLAATMYPTYRYSTAARDAMAAALFGSPYYIGDDVSATTYAQVTAGDKLAVDGAIFAVTLTASEQDAVSQGITRFFNRVDIDMASAKTPSQTSAYAILAAVSPSAAASWASDVAAGKDYADRFFVHLVKQSVTTYPAAYEPFWVILGYPTPPTNPSDAQVEACARLAGESDFKNRTAGTTYPTQREAQAQALYGKAYKDLTFFERRYADAAVYANLPSVFGAGASADAARAATRDAVAAGLNAAGYIAHNTYATCTGAEQAVVNQAIFATALPGPSLERDYIDFAAVPGAVLDWGAEMSAPLPLTQNIAYLTLKSQVTATAANHWKTDVQAGVSARQAFYRWLSKETVAQVVAMGSMIQLGLGEFTLKIRNLNGYLISVDTLHVVCQVESSATGSNVLVDAARQTISEKIWVPANGEASVTVIAPIKTYDVITWAILSGKSSADAQKLAADVWRQFQAGTATWHVTVEGSTDTPLPADFAIGNHVISTATLNVRSSAALGDNMIATMPKGSTGEVVGGPESSDGHTWWRIAYDAGSTTGWSAGDFLGMAPSQDSTAPAYFSALWVRETVKWTESYYAKDYWKRLCLQFAANAFMLEPDPPVAGRSGWSSACDAAGALPRFNQGPQGWLNAPRGALMFFLGADGNADGHVGIYLGDGKMVHAYVTVKENTVAEAQALPEVGPYIGWSYPPESWRPDLTVYELRDLEDTINRRLQQQSAYPPNLLNAESFAEAVTAVWTEFTSWTTQTNLNDMYYDFYLAGINYDSMRVSALIEARRSLKNGDVDRALVYLHKSETYERVSNISFQAANDVFLGNLDAAQTLAQGIKDGCQASVKFGLTFVNPEAARVADVLYDAVDFGLDSYISGTDEAVKNFIIKNAIQLVFNEVPFKKLGDRTLSDWMANRTGKQIFPVLSELVASEEFQWATSKVVKELVPTIAERVVTDIVTAVVDKMKSMVSTLDVKLNSPGELRVYNSSGQVVGLVDGAIECQIPQSMYCDETVTIFCPQDTYYYEVIGTDEGTYGLEATWVLGATTNTFNATYIPIAPGTVHRYTVDWDALSQGEKGVTIQVDSDGDGEFDKSITADTELTQNEFASAANQGGLPFWIWIIVGVVGVMIVGVLAYFVRRRVAI